MKSLLRTAVDDMRLRRRVVSGDAGKYQERLRKAREYYATPKGLAGVARRRRLVNRRQRLIQHVIDSLRPIRTCKEVGKIMGCCGENIRMQERRIIYKIVTRLQEAVRDDQALLMMEE